MMVHARAYLGSLNQLDEFGHASPITRRHAIHLVHDEHLLLEGGRGSVVVVILLKLR